jgi:hypothetical protein
VTSKSEFVGPFVSSTIFGSSSLLSSSMATLLNPFGLAAFSSFLAALGGASSVIVVDSSSSIISVTSVLSLLAYSLRRPTLAALRSLLTSLLSGCSSKINWKSLTAS